VRAPTDAAIQASRDDQGMFGLDQSIAGLSDGTTLLLVLGIALLLGLRHASDPDHLAAVTTLTTGSGARGARRAATLGFVWGTGHATSLFVFGLPIVLWRAYLPEGVQRGTEVTVGVLIAGLALWLLARWHSGALAPHAHARGRSRLGAYAIGLVHGMGGSAGIGVLLLAAIPDRALAVAGLAVFAAGTAVSMALLSAGFGRSLAGRPLLRLAPVLGVASLAFGLWYALGALDLAPYVF
jgi:hypothetical protein